MIGSGSANRRNGRLWRLLIGLQISLLAFSMVAPIGTIAADPADPPASPPPSAEPSAPPPPDPSPSAEPAAEPSAEPTPEATPAPTTDPSTAPAPEPIAEPTPDATPAPTPGPTSHYIVTFAAGVSAAEQADAVAAAGAATTDTIAALRMRAVDAGATALAALNADARVARVEPDRSRATEADPSDPGYGSQWALPTIGWDSVFGAPIAGSATVAILDTGVDGSQADLAGKLVTGTSLVGSEPTSDPNGHGTAMAGIVAAAADNGIGIAGVGYDGVSIMPVSVLGADGTGLDSDVIEGLVWAADHGADVALMAFSASGYSGALQAAIDYAWSKGVVLVAATGNDGSSSAAFPAGDRGVVGVSNTDASDTLNASSNYGDDTFLAAPGTGILTLDAGGGTTTITGTSASAAFVAGSAALLRAHDGSLSNGEIVGRLARTADAVGTPAQTGNGRLNLARAFSDTSTGSVQPEGAAPVGDGGPFVGPYVAAGAGVVAATVRDSVTNAVISGALVSCTAGCTGSGNSGTTNTSGVAQFTVNYSGNSSTVTLQATAAGYSANSGNVLVANTNNAASPATLTILLTPTNTAPIVDLNGGGAGINTTASFTEDAGPTAIAPIATVTDDGANLASATITLTNRPDGNAVESLAATTTGTSITAGYTAATGVLSLTGSDTLAHYQQVIRSVTYNNTSQNPSTANRIVNFVVNDGSLSSATPVDAVTVVSVNDAPVVVVSGNFAAVPEGTTRTYTYTITDVDSGSFTITESCGTGTTYTDTAAANSFDCKFLDGPGTSTVNVTANDGAAVNNTGTDPHAVSITNVAPTTTYVSGAATVSESDTATHTYVFSITDPGVDTVIGTGTTCGVGGTQDGPTVSTDTSITFDCKFPDGPADPGVQANATDSDGATGPFATFPVHVNNVAPVAVDDTGTTDENTNLIVAAPGVLANDSDVVGDLLAVARVDGAALNVGTEITLASGAKVTLNANGSYTYKPNGAFEFLDTGESTTDTFTYAASDGDALSNTATVTITITGVNDAPVASATSASLGHHDSAGVDLTLTATDADGEALTFSIAASPSHGALGTIGAVTCDGLTPSTCSAIVHYTPNSPSGDFVGTDTFTYQASDGTATSDVATATLTLTNSAPTATVDLTPTAPTTNQTLTATVTPGDADGDALTFTYVWKNGSTVVQTTSASSSTTDTLDLSLAGNGDKGETITVEVTPNDGHVSGSAATDSATVANSDPVIDSLTALPVSVNEGSGTVVSATAHDVDGDPLTYEFNCTADLDSIYEVGPGTTNSTTCTYDDGPAGHLAGARVSDGTASDEATTPVTVLSIAPTGTFSASTPVDEGSPSALSWTGVTDPSSADTAAGFHYSFACTSNLADLNFNYATAGTASTHPCTFDDNGSYGVEGAVIDKDNASSTSGGSVTVNNVPPTATLGNDGAVDEGSPATITFSNQHDPSSADTTAGFHYAFRCSLSDPALPTTYAAATNTTGSSTCTFDDGPGTYTVAARIFDNDDGFSEYTTSVHVNNVPPTATLGNNGPVNEGSPAPVSFSNQLDPSSADTTAGFHYAYSCSDGDLSAATYAGSGSSGSTTCTFDDGPSDHTVRARIIDKDGGFSEYTTSVHVNNVAPTPAITGAPASGPEGTLISLGSSVTDPSTADTTAGFTYAWSVTKNGNPFGSGGTSSTFSFTPDDNGAYVVTLQATDKDHDTGTTTASISVTNVAPSPTITGAPASSPEGTAIALGSTVTDPSSVDASAGFTYAWSVTKNGNPFGSGGTASTFSFTPDDNGTYVVTFKATDKDLDTGTTTASITVTNVAPTATLGNNGPVAEGSAASVSFTNLLDPSSVDTAAGFHYAFKCSPADPALPMTYAAATNSSGSSNCTFGDNGTYSVSGRIFDKDSGYTTYSTIVTVTNANPTTNTPIFTFNPFTGVASASIKYSDPGWLDTHTATITWGDGASMTFSPDTEEHGQPDATGSFNFGSHTYALGCVASQPKVVITDDDGGSVTYTYTLSVDHYSVAFQAPIQDGVRNIVKQGNVIPVKLQITNCAGQAVLGKTLSIGYVEGDLYDDADNGDLQVPDSVSNADTTGFMRQVDSKYMYNLATKSLKLSMPYSVVVREPSTNQFVASFVIQAKK